MRFSSKSRAACFYCISLDLLICIIFYVDQITCRCWGRQSADARHAKSRSEATNLHGAGASNLTDNTISHNFILNITLRFIFFNVLIHFLATAIIRISLFPFLFYLAPIPAFSAKYSLFAISSSCVSLDRHLNISS